jgi:hypothetical protein
MTENIDPFVKIKEMLAQGQEKAKKAVDRLITRKDSERARKALYIAELKACATESQSLMSDDRYPRHRKFLSELRAGYSRALEITPPDRSYEIADIQGQIKLLDKLMTRSERIVAELKAIEKQVADE